MWTDRIARNRHPHVSGLTLPIALWAITAMFGQGAKAQCAGQWTAPSDDFVLPGSAPAVRSLFEAQLDFGNGPQSALVAAGSFLSAGGTTVNSIAAWDGISWHPIGQWVTVHGDTIVGLPSAANAAATFNGELVVGCTWTPSGNHILHLVNGVWVPLGQNGTSSNVWALLEYEGRLYAGISGGLMVWDGATWTTPVTSASGGVFSLAALNGALFAGGDLTFPPPQDGGPAAGNIAQWDGTNWRPVGTNTIGPSIHALATYQGDLVAGQGEPGQQVFRLHNGAWAPLGPPMTSTGSITMFTYSLAEFHGQLYASGLIRNPCLNRTVARFDGTMWACLPDGHLAWARTSLVLNDELLVGGDTSFISTLALRAWTLPTPDFNHDGSPGTDADIDAFFSCLAGYCCPTCGTADFNADGDTGTDADIESFFRVLAGGSC